MKASKIEKLVSLMVEYDSKEVESSERSALGARIDDFADRLTSFEIEEIARNYGKQH